MFDSTVQVSDESSFLALIQWQQFVHTRRLGWYGAILHIADCKLRIIQKRVAVPGKPHEAVMLKVLYAKVVEVPVYIYARTVSVWIS